MNTTVFGTTDDVIDNKQETIIMLKTIALTTALIAGYLWAAEAFAAPAKAAAAKPTMIKVAVCKDGKTYSHPTGERRGACSGHGGVAVWADGTAPKARKGSYQITATNVCDARPDWCQVY